MAPVFFLFTLMLVELGLDIITLELMDTAAHDAARLIRIGTITGSSYSSTLTTDVCNDLALLPSCSTNIQIYVAAAASGATGGSGFTSLSSATVSGGVMTSTKATLAATDDVLLQVGYNRPWTIPWISSVMGSSQFLISTMAFQTEPY